MEILSLLVSSDKIPYTKFTDYDVVDIEGKSVEQNFREDERQFGSELHTTILQLSSQSMTKLAIPLDARDFLQNYEIIKNEQNAESLTYAGYCEILSKDLRVWDPVNNIQKYMELNETRKSLWAEGYRNVDTNSCWTKYRFRHKGKETWTKHCFKLNLSMIKSLLLKIYLCAKLSQLVKIRLLTFPSEKNILSVLLGINPRNTSSLRTPVEPKNIFLQHMLDTQDSVLNDIINSMSDEQEKLSMTLLWDAVLCPIYFVGYCLLLIYGGVNLDIFFNIAFAAISIKLVADILGISSIAHQSRDFLFSFKHLFSNHYRIMQAWLLLFIPVSWIKIAFYWLSAKVFSKATASVSDPSRVKLSLAHTAVNVKDVIREGQSKIKASLPVLSLAASDEEKNSNEKERKKDGVTGTVTPATELHQNIDTKDGAESVESDRVVIHIESDDEA